VGVEGHTGSAWHVAHFWPVVPDLGDCEDGEFDGMKIDRGNRSTPREPAIEPLCQPQNALDQTRTRTGAVAMGSQRLSA
jgi:hypothetical protein